MSKIIFFSAVLFFVFHANCLAETYWISPDGNAFGTGSYDRPFMSIDTALARAGGSNTFIFKPGYYKGQITIWPKDGGTPQNPTILKSQQKYKAILNGSPGHMIYASENCNWVIVDGFDISGAFYSGVKFGGSYCVLRNCRVHNNGLNGVEAHHVKHIVIENNLIEFNGKNPQYDHGIYLSGSNLTIRNNIVRFNSSFGLHLTEGISESVIENNLIHANQKYAIWINTDPNRSPNRIVNNTIVENRFGVCFVTPGKDIVANNIIICGSSALPAVLSFFGGRDINDVTVTNNLLNPLTENFKSSNFTGDPIFLNPVQGIFFLKEGSPTIGKGSLQYAPDKDLFGQNRKVKSSIDLGCYSYNSALLTPQAIKQLYGGWAFHTLDNQIPDLWNFPVKE